MTLQKQSVERCRTLIRVSTYAVVLSLLQNLSRPPMTGEVVSEQQGSLPTLRYSSRCRFARNSDQQFSRSPLRGSNFTGCVSQHAIADR